MISVNFKKAFGKNVSALRKAQRKTEEQVAVGAGISTAFLKKIESGDSNPTMKVIYNLAQSLGVPLYALVEENAADMYAQTMRAETSETGEKAMTYRVRIDMRQDDIGDWHMVYGVDAYQLVQSIPDIFTDYAEIRSFIELCDRLQPLPEHLTDIVQDRIAR